MLGKVLPGAGRRRRTRAFLALCSFSSIATAILSTAPAAAQSPPYVNDGLRWIGIANTCTAQGKWTAARLFRGPGLPPGFCLYTWTGEGVPRSEDVSDLFRASGASEMTEDVPVLSPSATLATAEEEFYTGLRTALRAQVGDASLMSSVPEHPQVRVVVIDSAPDASGGNIRPGVNRHGDTLAHLIEDIVCRPAGAPPSARVCAAEVTTVLALPWIAPGVRGENGGYFGTLADLARAIEQAVSTWQDGRHFAPDSTPARLILNLSLGWEDTPGIADCSTASEGIGPPARAVRRALQYAASQGALIVAAAGNDAGGPTPPTGMVCPGRYQAVPQEASRSQALLVAVSGVDYADRPLETARRLGITGIAGLGLGGVAWDPDDPAPPPLTGSSVSTAVVSAVSALVWAQHPNWSVSAITSAVYAGGVEVGAADHCPSLLGQCRSHRVSVCGALRAAGGSLDCSPAAPRPWSTPGLVAATATLASTYTNEQASNTVPGSLEAIARYSAPTVQVQPWTFPAPVSVPCRACVLVSGTESSELYLDLSEDGPVLDSPVLVVRFNGGGQQAIELENLMTTTSYLNLSIAPGVESAYLTGFQSPGVSVTEQIFIQQ